MQYILYIAYIYIYVYLKYRAFTPLVMHDKAPPYKAIITRHPHVVHVPGRVDEGSARTGSSREPPAAAIRPQHKYPIRLHVENDPEGQPGSRWLE